MNGPFGNRTFRRLFAGRLVTNAGDSLYYVAAMWLVYDLTGDPFYTGVAGFLTMLPAAFQALLGPLVDRFDLRRLLVVTQAVQGVAVLGLAAVTLADALSVWLLLAVLPLLALLNQFVYPAQSAVLPRILETDDLVAANSAFSLAYQGVEFAFNGLAGTLVALVGAGVLFVVDSATFGTAVVLFATLAIPPAGAGAPDGEDDGEPASAGTTDGADSGSKVTGAEVADDAAVADGGTAEPDDPGPVATYLADLRVGAGYLRGTFLVALMGGAVLVNAALGGAMSVLPAYADGLGGASAYGVLLAALSGGTLLGALLAGVAGEYPLGRVLAVGFATSGVAMLAALRVGWLPGTAALLGVATVPVGATNVLIASVVQAATPERLVGRVSATLGSASTVMQPVGALAGGAFASVFAPWLALAAGAVALLGLAGYVLAVPSLRTLPKPADVETLSSGDVAG